MNKIIVINPKSTNMLKAIYNATIIKLVDIIVFGNIKEMEFVCKQINLNTNLLTIIDCPNEETIYRKIKEFKGMNHVDAIIYDNVSKQIESVLNVECKFHLINYGIFHKSVFLIDNKTTQLTNIQKTIEFMNRLGIESKTLGIVTDNKEIFNTKRKWYKNEYNFKNVEMIDTTKINKCKNNVILFDSENLKKDFLKELKLQIIPRYLEIKKASNQIVIDAKGMELKNIFLGIILTSKLNANHKINAQAM